MDVVVDGARMKFQVIGAVMLPSCSSLIAEAREEVPPRQAFQIPGLVKVEVEVLLEVIPEMRTIVVPVASPAECHIGAMEEIDFLQTLEMAAFVCRERAGVFRLSHRRCQARRDAKEQMIRQHMHCLQRWAFRVRLQHRSQLFRWMLIHPAMG